LSYHQRIQKTIDHIERHLDEPLTLGELADMAGFSDFHYHRVFQSMAGDTVMEYVRKRRLARAACELADPERKIVDVAFEHGFQTHETFTRAFKRMFGMTPANYRKMGIRTPAYPKVDVLQNRYNPYLGGIRMEYRIETKPAFKFIGYALQTTCVDGQNLRDIPAFWQRHIAAEGWRRVPNAIHKDRPVELGICTDMNVDTGEFTYLIGMEAEYFEGVPEDLVCREFPEAEYAVFTTPKATREQFSPTIQATWSAIYGEWFPHSGYEHAGGPEIEWYDERSGPDAGDEQQMDIYLPVKRKAE